MTGPRYSKLLLLQGKIWHPRAEVLNPVGGTEPHRSHTCIHQTLRIWKNKMCVVNFIFFTFLLLKISCRRNPETDFTKPLGFVRTQVENHYGSFEYLGRIFLKYGIFLTQFVRF